MLRSNHILRTLVPSVKGDLRSLATAVKKYPKPLKTRKNEIDILHDPLWNMSLAFSKISRSEENYSERLCEWFQQATLEGDRLCFPAGCYLPCQQAGVELSSANGPIAIIRPVTCHVQWLYEYICSTQVKEDLGLSIPGLLVIGPPGCGKTWCAHFIIWKALKEGKVVVYELADKNLVLVLNPTDKKYCRKETGPANEVTVPELENPATVHVFDSKSGACGYEPSISVCRTIMFSSANASSYRQRERSFATVVYPSPSLHEMLAAADVFGLNPADVQRKYVKFGGSMRWVFGMTERMAEARLQQAVRALNIDDILSITQGAVSSDVTRSSGAPTALFTASVKPAHMKLLVKLAEAAEREEEAAPAAEGEAGLEGKEWTVSAGGEQKTGAGEAEEVEEAAVLPMRRRGELLIVYEESSIVWRISTEYIFDLLRRSAGDSIGKFVRRFVTAAKESATLGVARGNTLQVAAPDLLAEGKALPSRDLRTRAEGKYPFGHKRNVVLVQWKTVEEVLKNCKDKNTVYVINGSLPGFDIYLPPNIFVQSTSVITARHPINLEAAAQICAHCDAKGQPTEFLFLVPADTFHLWRNPQSFAYTPHKQLRLAGLALADQERVKSLHQSVLCLDLDKWVLAAEDLDAA